MRESEPLDLEDSRQVAAACVPNPDLDARQIGGPWRLSVSDNQSNSDNRSTIASTLSPRSSALRGEVACQLALQKTICHYVPVFTGKSALTDEEANSKS
jgi:hypothetical protein